MTTDLDSLTDSYERYTKYRERTSSHIQSVHKSLVATTVAIAGGAIVISLTLVKDLFIARTESAQAGTIIAWMLLTTAILAALAGQGLDMLVHWRYRVIGDREFTKSTEGAEKRTIEAQSKWILANYCTASCIVIQIACTVVGVAFLLRASLNGITSPLPAHATEATHVEQQIGPQGHTKDSNADATSTEGEPETAVEAEQGR